MTRLEAAIILGVLATADTNAVRKAFRAKSLQAHPDKGGTAEQFKRLAQARGVMLGKELAPEKFDDALRRWAQTRERAQHVQAMVIVIRGFGGSTTTATWF